MVESYHFFFLVKKLSLINIVRARQYHFILLCVFIFYFRCIIRNSDQKVATILGTLFGGVLLGAIITTVITKRARNKSSPNSRLVSFLYFWCICSSITNKTYMNNFFLVFREQSIEMFASNAMYCSPSAVARTSIQNN